VVHIFYAHFVLARTPLTFETKTCIALPAIQEIAYVAETLCSGREVLDSKFHYTSPSIQFS
jgi:hypothetical protein